MFGIPSEAERNKWLCWVICTLYPFSYIYSDIFSQNTGVLCVIGESNLPPSLKEKKKKSTQDIGTNTLCYKLIYMFPACIYCFHNSLLPFGHHLLYQHQIKYWGVLLLHLWVTPKENQAGRPGAALCVDIFSLPACPFPLSDYQGTTVVLHLCLDSVRRKTNWILYKEEKRKKKKAEECIKLCKW